VSKIIILCSSEDREWQDRIVSVLAGRGMADILDVWEDGHRAGTTGGWAGEYQQAIEQADVVVALISPNFLAYERHGQRPEIQSVLHSRSAPIYAILLRPSEWHEVGWLAGLPLHPEDGVALSNAESDEVDARLALVALEVSWLAGVPGPLSSISASLLDGGTFSGMATLVGPRYALSVPQGSTSGGDEPLTLQFARLGLVSDDLRKMAERTSGNQLDDVSIRHVARQVPPRETFLTLVEGRDSALDFCLLLLTSAVPGEIPPLSFELPPRGAIWECLAFQSATSPGLFTTGIVVGMATRDGREYLHLRPVEQVGAPRGMSGAPIIIDGKLVALLAKEGAILDEWLALPLKSIAASALGAAVWPASTTDSRTASGPIESDSVSKATASFDEADFISRLSAAARVSLGQAEGLRTALGEERLHVEHLILGLYGRTDSPMRRQARAAGILDLNSLLELLSPWNARLESNPKLVDLISRQQPITLEKLLHDLIPEREGCDVFRDYGRRVARYSFQSGRVLITQRLPECDD
jgi:hypothetical protein